MKFKKYKTFLVVITIATIFLIVLLTSDVIGETENWKYFDIDFKSKYDIVSAYGTLISGILSFLSILFVIYSLFDQKDQLNQEKIDKQIDYEKDLLNKIKMIGSLLKSVITDIKEQGEIFKEFSEKEIQNPSVMNRMYFNINKNISRVIDMDFESIYKATQLYFKKEDWEKDFLNIYSLMDFYSEALAELKVKYQAQISFKVAEQKKISYEMLDFMNISANLIDKYKIADPSNYLQYPWVSLVNEFIPKYYGYLDEQNQKREPSNFRTISDSYILPFLQSALEIRNRHGLDNLGSIEILGKASNIRKKIAELENYAIQYAEDIKLQYDSYFSETNRHFIALKALKEKIDLITG